MKSERRHELEHNELADWTGQAIDAIKPYTNLIVGATLAVVILAVGVSLWNKQSQTKSNTAWNLYYEALDADDPALLQDVIEMYPSSEAAQWAIVAQGDLFFANGSYGLFIDKANANQELDKAVECYKIAQKIGNKMLDARAAFGLARSYEAKGDIKKAKAAYETLIKKQKDSPYAETAEDRLADLQKTSTLEFYDLLAKYDPKPALSPEDKPTTSPLPSFEATDVPVFETTDVPVIKEPTSPEEEKPADQPNKESAEQE